MILLGCFYILLSLLLPIDTHKLVYHHLRTSALMVVVNLVPIRCHTGGDDMQVQVVGVVVCIDEPGLSGFGIAHFL